jgi:hypothetical protein
MATQLLETDGISNVLLVDLDTSALLSIPRLQKAIQDGKLILMALDVALEESAMAFAAKARQLPNKLVGAVFLTGTSLCAERASPESFAESSASSSRSWVDTDVDEVDQSLRQNMQSSECIAVLGKELSLCKFLLGSSISRRC